MEAYSYSSLTSFEKCPRAFRHRYIDGLEEAFTTIEQHLGQVVHGTLEKLYAAAASAAAASAASTDGERPGLDWVDATYGRLWSFPDPAVHRIVRPGRSAADYGREGLALVRAFHERVFRSDSSTTLHLEHRFTYPLVAEEEEHAWNGVIDRVSRLADGTLRITDYKTGRTVPDPADDLQMKSYALHVLALHGGEQVQLCFEDLRGARTKTAVFAAREAERVRARLLASIRRIEEERDFQPRPSSLCAWCGFNPVCDAARR